MPSKTDDVLGSFFRAILSIQNNQLPVAERYIAMCRGMVDSELTALVGESYTRAYDVVCKVQQLSELEEIIRAKKEGRIDPVMLLAWNRRLLGCKRNVEVWQKILSVRSLMLPPSEDHATWLKFASHTLATLVAAQPDVPLLDAVQESPPEVQFGFLEQMWAEGERDAAVLRLKALTGTGNESRAAGLRRPSMSMSAVTSAGTAKPQFLSRCFLRLSEWQEELQPSLAVVEKTMTDVLINCQKATQLDPGYYKAWHRWGLVNYNMVLHHDQKKAREKLRMYLIPSIHGFFKSIALAPARSLQDTLRLLQLWFKFGSEEGVEQALSEGFASVSIDNWLRVIPQIIARIHR
jgi:FKBP12-rapamycin complex-associated protein